MKSVITFDGEHEASRLGEEIFDVCATVYPLVVETEPVGRAGVGS